MWLKKGHPFSKTENVNKALSNGTELVIILSNTVVFITYYILVNMNSDFWQ